MKPPSVHLNTIGRFVIAITLALAALGAGACDDPVKPTPTPTPTPTPASPPSNDPLHVVSVDPRIGFTAGGIPIALWGSGFAAGTTVALGGSPVTITHLDSNRIEGTIPSHDAGSVDVVVTNRSGQVARLANYFTYFANIPAPRILRASLGSVSTEGGAPLVVSGHDFFPGTTLTIDGVLVPGRVGSEAEGWTGSFVAVTTPAHAAGRVDIVVTNPDGQSDRLPGGLEYVHPESLDFDGNWVSISGDWDEGLPATLQFRIENNIVISVACKGKELTDSPRPSVDRGAFSVLLPGGGSLTGRIVGTNVAIGTSNIPGCYSGAWEAWNYESEPTSLSAALNLGFPKRRR